MNTIRNAWPKLLFLAAVLTAAEGVEVRPPLSQLDKATLRAIVIERRHDAEILRFAPDWIDAIRNQTPSSSVGIYVALELLAKYEPLTIKEALDLHIYLSRQYGEMESNLQPRLIRQWVGFVPAQAEPEQVADEMERSGWRFDRASFLAMLLAKRQEAALSLEEHAVGKRRIIVEHLSPFGVERERMLPPKALTLGNKTP